MSAWAKPGVQVVCIRSVWSPALAALGVISPAVGDVLTIREVIVANRMSTRTPGVGFRFVEIKNPMMSWPDGSMAEVGFVMEHFRPLVTHTQEQDVEQFLPLLNTVEEPA